MHPDLHRYLDGELTRDALAPELRIDADAWEEILAEVAQFHDDTAPQWLEERVVAALPEEPRRPAWRRLWRWFIVPQPMRIRPAVALVGTVAVVVLLARPPQSSQTIIRVPGSFAGAEPVTAPTTEPVAAASPMVYVQFVFSGADASSVAVAGDFNAWDPERHVLRDPDGDGVWTGMFALPPGLHKYMFVVDGERWETDPRAERYVDDGFGMRNALISVAAPAGRAS